MIIFSVYSSLIIRLFSLQYISYCLGAYSCNLLWQHLSFSAESHTNNLMMIQWRRVKCSFLSQNSMHSTDIFRTCCFKWCREILVTVIHLMTCYIGLNVARILCLFKRKRYLKENEVCGFVGQTEGVLWAWSRLLESMVCWNRQKHLLHLFPLAWKWYSQNK